MRGVFVLIGTLCLSQLLVAQSIPDFSHQMKFRIYGKKAKPVSLKKAKTDRGGEATVIHKGSSGYKVWLDYTGESEERFYGLETQLRQGWEDSIYYMSVRSSMGSSANSTLNIDGPDGLMKIHTGVGLDSIPYMPGAYRIPEEYWPLFHLKSLNGSIDHRTILSFKEGDDAYKSAGSLRTERVLSDTQFATLLKTEKWIYAMTGLADRAPHRLWRSSDGGDTWENVLEEFEVMRIVAVPGVDDRVLAFALSDGTPTAIWVLDNRGRSSPKVAIDSSLTKIRAYDAHFVNAEVGFALAETGQKIQEFYRTLDGGLMWQRMSDTLPNDLFRVVGFGDSLRGYIVHDRKFALGQYYQTLDGGKTWAHYTIHDMDQQSFDPNIHRTALYYRNLSNLALTTEHELIPVHPGVVRVWGDRHYRMYDRFRFYNNDVALLLGRHYVLYTSDGGAHWQYYPYQGWPMEYEEKIWYQGGLPHDLLFLDERTFLLLDDDRVVRVQLEAP